MEAGPAHASGRILDPAHGCTRLLCPDLLGRPRRPVSDHVRVSISGNTAVRAGDRKQAHLTGGSKDAASHEKCIDAEMICPPIPGVPDWGDISL